MSVGDQARFRNDDGSAEPGVAAALASGRPVPMPHEDPDVLAAVRAAAADQPAIAGVGVMATLGGRLRRGFTIAVTPPPGDRGA